MQQLIPCLVCRSCFEFSNLLSWRSSWCLPHYFRCAIFRCSHSRRCDRWCLRIRRRRHINAGSFCVCSSNDRRAFRRRRRNFPLNIIATSVTFFSVFAGVLDFISMEPTESTFAANTPSRGDIRRESYRPGFSSSIESN